MQKTRRQNSIRMRTRGDRAHILTTVHRVFWQRFLLTFLRELVSENLEWKNAMKIPLYPEAWKYRREIQN